LPVGVAAPGAGLPTARSTRDKAQEGQAVCTQLRCRRFGHVTSVPCPCDGRVTVATPYPTHGMPHTSMIQAGVQAQHGSRTISAAKLRRHSKSSRVTVHAVMVARRSSCSFRLCEPQVKSIQSNPIQSNPIRSKHGGACSMSLSEPSLLLSSCEVLLLAVRSQPNPSQRSRRSHPPTHSLERRQHAQPRLPALRPSISPRQAHTPAVWRSVRAGQASCHPPCAAP